MTKAEKKARKAQRAARVVVEKHAALEQRAVAVIDSLNREVMELRQTQEVFREMLFGALLGRALGGLQVAGKVGREPLREQPLLRRLGGPLVLGSRIQDADLDGRRRLARLGQDHAEADVQGWPLGLKVRR